MRSFSYLHKMIVFGILLSTLPILLTGIAAFIYSSKQSELHRAQANKQLLIQMQTNVEHKLATVSYMLDQAVRSPDTLRSLTSSSSIQDTGPLFAEKLQNEFNNMRSWEPLMDITLVNQTQDWLIDHAGLYLNTDFPMALPMKDLLSNTLTSGWQLTPSSVFNNNERPVNSGCIYHIALARSIPDVNVSSDAALIAGIPACSLQKPLEEDSPGSSTAGLIILNREHRIMVHPDPEYIGQPLAAAGIKDSESGSNFSELLSIRGFAASSGQREVRIADTRYSLSYTHSSLKGWTYILISPTNIITHEYVQIGLHTMYISVAMLLLSMLVSWAGSRRMVIPIRKLLVQLGDKRLSRGNLETNSTLHMDEFEQIRAAVSQLSASQSQLESKLKQYKLQIHTHFLINLLLGKNAPSTLHDTLRENGYGSQLQEWQQIAVIAIQADLMNHPKYHAKDRDLLLFAVQNILEESIYAEQQLLPVVFDQAVVTIIGTSEQDHVRFSQHLHTLTEQLQHQISEILSLQVSIGFSQPHASLFQIPQAYTEALEALKHRMKLGAGIIFQFEAIDNRTSHWALPYPESLEYILIQAIQNADEAQASSHLHQLLEVLFGMECTPEEYQVALTRLLTHILQMMQESGIRLGQISKGHGSIFNELHALQYAAEVEHWFNTHIIIPIILILKERQYAQYQHISEKMIAIIQQEYDKDLTLEECASRLHYNANYLSSVFRKETGCAFSEYLTKHRFSIAKKWLDESELTVKDIAARLRYNNPQNFIRSFRKWEGITPGQYRERKQKPDLSMKQ
ncbi:helix-turn-helix domain-containing protein [Paenibacillus pabuli]|uniref:YesN/AraC family two-component response regulator n=2 Tax=Paenibacillus TaxID=44249 RepID=A0A855XLZ6_9BACL|nr:helix-turn-helix domain-containing protein [Paenibacillus pabuli]PWW32668.1 YesN/AraC family two-component response regulator [Paenibacillus pabuli]PXV98383.1 YesN/AraC family two-component response regulator [Paenibacillus taichungensis]